jgi:hypothetical protein
MMLKFGGAPKSIAVISGLLFALVLSEMMGKISAGIIFRNGIGPG